MKTKPNWCYDDNLCVNPENNVKYFSSIHLSRSYCAPLYDGLKSCPQDRHIHVLCDTDYIAHLIGRAEPELAGG